VTCLSHPHASSTLVHLDLGSAIDQRVTPLGTPGSHGRHSGRVLKSLRSSAAGTRHPAHGDMLAGSTGLGTATRPHGPSGGNRSLKARRNPTK
jgi:hypothetical protein